MIIHVIIQAFSALESAKQRRGKYYVHVIENNYVDVSYNESLPIEEKMFEEKIEEKKKKCFDGCRKALECTRRCLKKEIYLSNRQRKMVSPVVLENNELYLSITPISFQ